MALPMRMMPLLLLASTIIVLLPAVSLADTFRDDTLGFSLVLPDGFVRQDAPPHPDIVHSFALPVPGSNPPQILLLIERMRAQISNERFAPHLPPDFSGTLSDRRWQGFVLDAVEIHEQLAGQELVTYNVQVPLSPEAIQLRLVGSAQVAQRLDKLLDQILAGLHGKTNWLRSIAPAALSSSVHYASMLFIITIVLLISGLVVLLLVSRKTPRGTVLFIAFAIYVIGWALPDSRVRELRLLEGLFKMLGSGGILLGLVMLFVKRRAPNRIPPTSAV